VPKNGAFREFMQWVLGVLMVIVLGLAGWAWSQTTENIKRNTVLLETIEKRTMQMQFTDSLLIIRLNTLEERLP